nr:MAG TPA: hypothetical protein [Caudoviricetes sp.]
MVIRLHYQTVVRSSRLLFQLFIYHHVSHG